MPKKDSDLKKYLMSLPQEVVANIIVDALLEDGGNVLTSSLFTVWNTLLDGFMKRQLQNNSLYDLNRVGYALREEGTPTMYLTMGDLYRFGLHVKVTEEQYTKLVLCPTMHMPDLFTTCSSSFAATPSEAIDPMNVHWRIIEDEDKEPRVVWVRRVADTFFGKHYIIVGRDETTELEINYVAKQTTA